VLNNIIIMSENESDYEYQRGDGNTQKSNHEEEEYGDDSLPPAEVETGDLVTVATATSTANGASQKVQPLVTADAQAHVRGGNASADNISAIEQEEKNMVRMKPFPAIFKSKTWKLALGIDLPETELAWNTFVAQKGEVYWQDLQDQQEAAEEEEAAGATPNKKKKKKNVPTIDKPFAAILSILVENHSSNTGSEESVGKIMLCKTCFDMPSCKLTDAMLRCSINKNTASKHPMVGNVVKHYESHSRGCLMHEHVWTAYRSANPLQLPTRKRGAGASLVSCVPAKTTRKMKKEGSSKSMKMTAAVDGVGNGAATATASPK
jgi:hypothetical protein